MFCVSGVYADQYCGVTRTLKRKTKEIYRIPIQIDSCLIAIWQGLYDF